MDEKKNVAQALDQVKALGMEGFILVGFVRGDDSKQKMELVAVNLGPALVGQAAVVVNKIAQDVIFDGAKEKRDVPSPADR